MGQKQIRANRLTINTYKLKIRVIRVPTSATRNSLLTTDNSQPTTKKSAPIRVAQHPCHPCPNLCNPQSTTHDSQLTTHYNKKTRPFDLAFLSSNPWCFSRESNYFLCFFRRCLSAIDTIKLATAPIEANTTVLKTSSECKFGNTLKKVPPAVPIRV
jgi:hypothetical protein